MSRERRSRPRRAVEVSAQVEGPRGVHRLLIRDLSIDGLFIESGRPYPSGTRLECRIDLRPHAIEVTAEVRHQSNTYQTEDGRGPYKGMGLRFLRLGADEMAILREFLGRLTPTKPQG